MKAKKVMIIGGAGFIGSNIAKELLTLNHKVLVYDNFSCYIPREQSFYNFYLPKRLKRIKDKAKIVRGDVYDKPKLIDTMRDFKPEIVINMVAIPLATASDEFFEDAIQINLNGHINVLEAIRYSNSVERFLYSSSSFVYGHFKYDPADEDHPTLPIDIYGGTKLSCEILSRSFSKKFGIEHVIIRPSAVYGPTDVNRRVSQIFLEKALLGETLGLYNGGEDKVDFTYITDIAHGFVLATLSPNAANQTFNITAGEGKSAKEFAEILDKILPIKVKTEIKPTDLNRPIRGSLDISKARKLLGYEPKYQLEEGLKEYVNYIKTTGLFKKAFKK
ncbi:MAG: NAD-dependent epimerase/dehydratase family protein [Candidatus Zambryskibacteria bacterium]|nr:NAD-dependent epimerase/dehydratase family protein [Candidatus Zambryskibacteria bacterium]